jgi:hypothetical protein
LGSHRWLDHQEGEHKQDLLHRAVLCCVVSCRVLEKIVEPRQVVNTEVFLFLVLVFVVRRPSTFDKREKYFWNESGACMRANPGSRLKKQNYYVEPFLKYSSKWPTVVVLDTQSTAS